MSRDATTPGPERARRIERALEDYLLAADAGRAPDPREWLDHHPDLQPELGELLAVQEGLERLVSPLRPARAPAEPTATVEAAPVRSPGELRWCPPSGHDPTLAGDPRPSDAPTTDLPGPADEATDDLGRAAGEPAEGPTVGARVRYVGDYELRRVLGRGGMGVVYRARQMSLNRTVALKMLAAGALAGDDDLRRFRNEAEAVAQLDHPHIVPIHEVGVHDGRHYFSMKLIAGGSLAERLAAYRDDPRAAARLVATAAEAVHHAHQRGILHRDLKPSNILLDESGAPHVSDFGLAKRIAADSEQTRTGALVGTPAYMAPEQASGRRGAVTTAADVYGLGAVLYALLAGRAPFGGASALEVLDQVRARPPEPPSRSNPRVPRDLEVICLKCLNKDPSHRYASAAALAEDLRRWLADVPILARPVGRAEQFRLWCRRNPVIAGLAGAVGLLLVALAVGSAIAAYRYSRLAEKEHRTAGREREAAAKALAAERAARNAADVARRNAYFADIGLAQNAFERADLARVAEMLAPHQPGRGETDLRGWEWHYLWGVSHAAWTFEMGSDRQRFETAFSRDGRLLAVATPDAVRVLDAATGRVLARRAAQLPNKDAQRLQWALRFDLSGRILNVLEAGAGRAMVWVTRWAWSEGRDLSAGRWPIDPICAAIGPDGDAFVSDPSNPKGGLVYLSPDTGRATEMAESKGWNPWDLRLSSEGTRLVLNLGRNEFSLLELDPSRPGAASPTLGRRVVVGDRAGGDAVEGDISPDGRWLACIEKGDRSRIRLLDLVEGRLVKTFTLEGQGPGVSAIWFRPPDGQRLAARVGEPPAFIGDGAGDALELMSWDVAIGGSRSAEVSLAGGDPWDGAADSHPVVVTPIELSPDGRSYLGVDRSWSRLSLHGLGPPGEAPWPSAAPDKGGEPAWGISARRWLWWCEAGRLAVADLGAGDQVRWLSDPADPTGPRVETAVVTGDGRRVVTFETAPGRKKPDVVRVWDVDTGRPVRRATLPVGDVEDYRFSPDGASVLLQERVQQPDGSSRYRVRGFDVGTGREVFDGATRGMARVLDLSPDGRWVAGTFYGERRLTLAELATGRRRVVEGVAASGSPLAACFSPDARQVGWVDWDGNIALWDLLTGPVRRLGVLQEPRSVNLMSDGGNGPSASLAFTPDGSRLAVGEFDELRLWDVASGREVLTNLARWPIDLHWRVDQLEFLPDGRLVTSWRCVLDGRPRAGAAREEREALGVVRRLREWPRTRGEVVAAIEADPTLSGPVRRRALAAASDLRDDPAVLLSDCWRLLNWPYRPAALYELALRTAGTVERGGQQRFEAGAARGAALYRLGRFPEAIESLGEDVLSSLPQSEKAVKFARLYRALTLARLGRVAEARAILSKPDPGPDLGPLLMTMVADLRAEADDLLRDVGLPADPFAR